MASAPSTFFFVCGDDDFLVENRAREAFAQLSAGLADDFSKEIIEGGAQNVDEVAEAVARFAAAAQTVSLFGDRKAVWLKGITFLGASRTGESKGAKAEVERLITVLKGIDYASVGVVVSASPVDQRKSEFKTLKSEGEFISVGGEDISPDALLGETAAALGASFSRGAAEYLYAKLQGNVRLCMEETRKLALYLGGEKNARITPDLIDELVPGYGESEFFEPVSAFFENDLPKTLGAVQRYFFTRKDARGLLSSLQNRLRLLVQMRALLDSGAVRLSGNWIDKASFDAAKGRFGESFAADDKGSLFAQRPNGLGFLARDAGRFRLKRLLDFHGEFLRAFTGIIERPNDQESVLRECAVRCLSSESAQK